MFNWDNKRKSRMGISQFRRLRAGIALHVLAVATVLLFATTNAHAEYLNLLQEGATGTINGAIYTQGSQNAGTGVFPAFVRIQAQSTEQGYNTIVNNTFDNTSDDTHNFAIQVSDLTQVTVGGVTYYQFFLDINESNGQNGGDNDDGFISLDAVKIYISPTGNSGEDGAGALADGGPLGDLIYDMDFGTNDGVLLDFNLESGSGFADMTLLVPTSLFGSDPDAFVYLYSQFGLLTDPASADCTGGDVTGGAPGCATAGDYTTSDGFEEWAFKLDGDVVIPEPSTYALYALGASMLFVSGWWQKRRTASGKGRS